MDNENSRKWCRTQAVHELSQSNTLMDMLREPGREWNAEEQAIHRLLAHQRQVATTWALLALSAPEE